MHALFLGVELSERCLEWSGRLNEALFFLLPVSWSPVKRKNVRFVLIKQIYESILLIEC